MTAHLPAYFRHAARPALQIVEEVAQKYELSVNDLLGPCRKRHIAWPRHEAWLRVFDETKFSWAEMELIFGKNRETIRHGVDAAIFRIKEGLMA